MRSQCVKKVVVDFSVQIISSIGIFTNLDMCVFFCSYFSLLKNCILPKFSF